MYHLCIGIHIGNIKTNRTLYAVEIVVQTRIFINEQRSGYTAQIQRITQIHLKITLDEFNSAYHYGLLDKEFAKQLILNGREYCETVLTGRNPDEVFLKSADYVSEICCVRHPYKKGISARKGIEY
jgi:ATP:corrinoid adenosyltransferase